MTIKHLLPIINKKKKSRIKWIKLESVLYLKKSVLYFKKN